MKKELFKGVCTALVTPFCDDGKVDYLALETLIQRQIDAQVDAILVLGTTGESSTINYKERQQIIKLARKLISPPTKLLVGAGCNDTAKALKYTLQAQRLKADGVLIVTPYYSKCSQKGAFEHYKYIAENSNIPIILYNVPSRTGFNLSIDTIAQLSIFQNIVGIKEANPNIDHIKQLCKSIKNMAIYSGNDDQNYLFLSLNASGVISVLSNIFPKKLRQMITIAQRNIDGIKCEFEKMQIFCKNLFVDVNPIPVKYVLYRLNLIKYNYRLPLTRLNTKDEIIIDYTFNLTQK